jgi:hypothetical protein
VKTELALLLSYSSPVVLAKDVAALMGIGERTLENQIYAKACPVPMFKLGSSWAAHISDIANYIDNQHADAMRLLQTPPIPA